jgi:hypothetical protein
MRAHGDSARATEAGLKTGGYDAVAGAGLKTGGYWR